MISSTADWFSYLWASLCLHLPVESLKPEFRRLFLQDLSWNAEVNLITIFYEFYELLSVLAYSNKQSSQAYACSLALLVQLMTDKCRKLKECFLICLSLTVLCLFAKNTPLFYLWGAKVESSRLLEKMDHYYQKNLK